MEDILRKLIAFPTVTGNAQAMHELLDYVSDFVQARGMSVKRYTWDGYESLVATMVPGHKTPKVMLAAHADVVPASKNLFQLRKDGDKYYGRGVVDMKFGLAAYLQIIDDNKDNLQNYDIGLMVTADEEAGGANGTQKLIEEGYIPSVCLLPDGGQDWQIQTSANGVLLFDISAFGTAAHGSRPWLGENAITKLLTALDEIYTLFPKRLQPGSNSLSLTKINAGEAITQIPGTANMTLDVRSINGTEHLRLYDSIHAICRAHDLTCEDIVVGSPVSLDLADPYVAPYARLITEVTDIPVQGSHAEGASDARYYVPYGVPCISLYPIGGGLHADDEWIGIQAFEQFRIITERYIKEIAVQSLSTATPPLTLAR